MVSINTGDRKMDSRAGRVSERIKEGSQESERRNKRTKARNQTSMRESRAAVIEERYASESSKEESRMYG